MPGVVFGALFNAGQTCLSVERVLVARRVHDDFVRRATELVASLRAGAGDDADVGPMVTPAQVDIVERHVARRGGRGRSGARGGRTPGAGVAASTCPTVLVDVDPSMDVARNESFGPLLPVLPFDDEDEAVRLANASRLRALRQRLDSRLARVAFVWLAGCAPAGCPSTTFSATTRCRGCPWAAMGESGFGRRRGLEGLEEMTRTRTMLVDRGGRSREPWWFPYGESQTRLIRAVLEWRARRGPAGLLAFMRGMVRRRGPHGE